MTDSSHRVRALQPEDVPRCAEILDALPEWFGIEAANRAYVESLRVLPAAVAVCDEQVAGFVALFEHDPRSFELHVLAVAREQHRRGIGTALVRAAEQLARGRGARWLHVKTRGPATPDLDYERTRLFYVAAGFEPLFETLALWGPENSALIMVKALG
jgi:GNAT superfamily N-acetyltransferase